MWLDNLIGWISPKAGAERAAYRAYIEEIRSYDAGNGNRANAGWRVSNASAEYTDRSSRDVIRARARDLERNSDIANSILSAYKRNIIGAGYVLRAKTPDPEVNKLIQKEWIRWCRAKNCDVTEQQSFMQMMRMAIERKKVDGGILFKKCVVPDKRVPLQLQALEVDEIDTTSAQKVHYKGNKVVNGVEYNECNKIVGFWIRRYDIDGWALEDPQYVPAEEMIYVYTKRRPSQIREISDMTQTISRVRDANEYMTAISVKERVSACLAVFIKRTVPNQIGRTNMSAENRKEYAGTTITPGMIRELNAGDEIQTVNPSGQALDAAQMIKLHQRMIGAGQGLSYEATSRDMSQCNYSSARQGWIEDGLTYIEDEELFIEKVFDDVYEAFVQALYLSGILQIKDFYNRKDDYLEHEWVPIPKKWIDPQKEANGDKIAVSNGIKTYQQIAAENGRDWKNQIDEIIEVLEYGREKGVELGGILYGKSEDELYTDDGEDKKQE